MNGLDRNIVMAKYSGAFLVWKSYSEPEIDTGMIQKKN